MAEAVGIELAVCLLVRCDPDFYSNSAWEADIKGGGTHFNVYAAYHFQ